MNRCSSRRFTIEPKKLAEFCARLAAEKKAEKIAVLHVGELLAIVEYFVICTGLNTRQVKSIAEEIDKSAKREGVKKLFIDGTEHGKWVCLDFSDVVVHVMLPEQREFYGLEHLWADAPRHTIEGITNRKPRSDSDSDSDSESESETLDGAEAAS